MMNVLEKILKEIEEATFQEDAPIYAGNKEIDGCVRESVVKELIRSHMDEVASNDWIPVSERLPEPDKIVEITRHCSEWTSDHNSDWVPKDEKVHHEEEYIVNVGYMDKDGDWVAFDGEGYEVCCDKEFGTDKGCVYSVVIAWEPLPEPYKGE